MPYLPSRLPAAQYLCPVRISNPPWIMDVFPGIRFFFPFHHPGFSRGGRELQLTGPDSSAAGAASGVPGKPSGTFHEKQYPSHKKTCFRRGCILPLFMVAGNRNEGAFPTCPPHLKLLL